MKLASITLKSGTLVKLENSVLQFDLESAADEHVPKIVDFLQSQTSAWLASTEPKCTLKKLVKTGFIEFHDFYVKKMSLIINKSNRDVVSLIHHFKRLNIP